MSQALTMAIDQVQHDLHMAKLAGKPADRLEVRLAELYAEQAAETEQTLAILATFNAGGRPRTFQSFPSGEEGFRCHAYQVLLRKGEHGYCYGCRSDLEL